MKDGRRVPLSLLRRRLKVEEYESETPYDETPCAPHSVRIKLLQHVGTAAVPVVEVGQEVSRGDVIATSSLDDMGVSVHASIDGRVDEICEEAIRVVAH